MNDDYINLKGVPEYDLVKLTFGNRGFKKNPKLKKIGATFEWTKEGVEEYAKCAKDPIYFIETYMKIIHGDDGLIPFKLRGYQKDMLQKIHNNRRIIMTMARQSGKSVAMVGYILWFILFNEHVTAALLANKEKTALEILAKAHLAYMHLPLFLQQGIMEWNKGSIVLENGSRVIADATASDAVRGYTINLLVLDEAAHVENWDAFSTSVIPTISSMKTSKIVQISTPKGLNHFYQTWINAQPDSKNPNGYIPIMVTWQQVPDRDENWRKIALEELNHDEDKFAQEYSGEFLGSSGTLIAGWKLKELLVHTQSIIPIQADTFLKKYKEPIKNHYYAMACDVSEGKGLDYNTFSLIDVSALPYEQVVAYRSNQSSPAEFAQIIYETAKAYNAPMILIELNCAVGGQLSDVLFDDYNYDNLLYTKNHGSHGIKVTNESGKSVYRGLKQTISTRRTGCSIAKMLIEQDKLILNDLDTVKEFCVFSRDEGMTKFEAEEGYHDDSVMSIVMFAWLTDNEYFRETNDIKTISKLRTIDEEQIEADLLPFGFSPQNSPMVPAINQHHYEDLFFHYKDKEYSWINKDEIVFEDEDEKPINF